MLSYDDMKAFGSNCKKFFELSPDTMGLYGRKFNNVNIEIYPGIYSDDDVFISFLKELQRTLSAEFPVSNTDRGVFIGAPISNDFSTLKTKAGSIRPPSHARGVEVDLNDYTYGSDNDMTLFDKLMRVRYHKNFFLNKLCRISNDSSSGAPFFINDAYRKKKLLAVLSNHLDALDHFIEHNDLSNLFEKLGILFFSNTQIRRQADIWKHGKPKERKYLSFEQAFAYNAIDRSYSHRESMYSDHLGRDTGLATCRTRSVSAYSAVINYLFTALVVGFRDGADKRFDFTYKHRTQYDILSKCRRFGYYRGLDVKNFDGSIPFQLINRWIKNLPITDTAKRMVQLLMIAPKYDSETKLASGDPLDVSTFRYWTGLPSGVFCTSMIGKDVMSFLILSAIQKYKGRILSEDDIMLILDGKDDIGFLNQGDDSVIMSRVDDIDNIIDLIDNEAFTIECEDAISFLGNLLFIDSNNTLNICNNLSSYFDKIYVAERSINSKLRPYPILGFIERRKIYKSHPLFQTARTIEQDIFKTYFKKDQDNLEIEHYKSPTAASSLSSIDAEVLTDPDKLKYKYEDEDVQDWIAALVSSSIDEPVQTKIQERYLNYE